MPVSPLRPEQLRLICDPTGLSFETTADVKPSDAIIGQPRATQALEFGMGIRSKGYNIYVTGSPSTGRSTVIQRFLKQRSSREPVPNDWVYVYNFETPYRPQAISLPPGMGQTFQEDMKHLVESLGRDLSKAFDSPTYHAALRQLREELDQKREESVQELHRKAADQGLALKETPSGPVVTTADNQTNGSGETTPMSDEQFALNERRRALQAELQEAMRAIRQLEKETRNKRKELDREVAEAAMGDQFESLRQQYAGQEGVLDYLEALYDDVLDQLEQSNTPPDEEPSQSVDLRRYEANLLVDNSETEGAPVIVQLNPTYENLFGRLELEMQGNVATTHFTQIKAGDLHMANGGYLVMYAHDLVFRQREAWEALKRALKAGEIEIRSARSDGPPVAQALRPEPIPLTIKIILLGSLDSFYWLHNHDEDVSKLFKVQADFNDTMPRDEAHERAYAEFVAARCQEEKLRPFDASAVARIIEHGSRLAAHQKKLSARFGIVADLVREADYWAGTRGQEIVTADDVRRALLERTRRANQEAEQERERILEGSIFIATDGCVIGQVNGLTVHDIGDHTFGEVGRITARTFMGDGGVIHIERETDMSGPIHEKGVLTLNAYLGGTYAQRQPLSLNASLTFEQNYVEIEGDSASSTELYALLSSLGQLPVNQAIGVTGSVNQRGEVQPIGAVNEKIEGFFDVCAARGLTGRHGVIIPASNVVNLMLREDIVEAAAKDRFHIWPVQSIDEGMELLTGMQAGRRDEQDGYPPGTVHAAVQQRLLEMALDLKTFGDGKEEPEQEKR